MKVLITGATGLVGAEIVSLCLSEGISVHYLTTQSAKIVAKENYKGYLWNPEKGEIDLACFIGVTTIINLAGSAVAKRWSKTYKKKIKSSRVASIQTIFDALSNFNEHTVKHIISASAVGLYKDSESTLYEEDSKEIGTDFLAKVVKKWEAELAPFKTKNITVSILRIGLVLSKNGGMLPMVLQSVKMYLGAAFGKGDQWQSWIHISDLAALFVYLRNNELEGVYNAVAPNPVTQSKFIRVLAATANKPLILPNIPAVILKFFLGELATMLLSSQRVSSNKIEDAGFKFQYRNIMAAMESLILK